jgi:hypothetical protein
MSGRRLTFSIRYGLKNATKRFKHPVPRLAHFAFVELNPIDSKIDTE